MERYAIAGLSSQGRGKPARNNSVSWGDFWSDYGSFSSSKKY